MKIGSYPGISMAVGLKSHFLKKSLSFDMRTTHYNSWNLSLAILYARDIEQ